MKKHKHHHASDQKSVLDSSPSHLLHRVLQIALDIYHSETGEGALTQRQYALLQAISDSEAHGDGLSQTGLVQATGIDRSTLADMVTRMTAKGFLVREKSTTDARANLIRLSESGQTALTEIAPKVAAADEKILELLSAPKRESFVKLLRKLAQSQEEASGAPKEGAKSAENQDEAQDGAKPKGSKKAPKAEKKPKKAKKTPKAHKKERFKLMPPLSAGAESKDETKDETPKAVTAPEVSDA